MGTTINKEERKELARLYYMSGLTQAEAAEKAGVSKVTMNKYVAKYKWDELRASITITREEQLKMLYRQIADINNAISARPERERHATPSEADSINKLAAAINRMENETGLADIVSVSQRMLEWVRRVDLEKAKELSSLFDGFIKDSIK